MKTLNIITPCSRPENLPIIYKDLSQYTNKIKINWWIILDGSLWEKGREIVLIKEDVWFNILVSPYKNSIGGHLHRNFIFRILKTQIPEEWCYMLDDDNLIHPELIDWFTYKEDLENGSWAFFSTVKNDGGIIEANTNNIKIGHVDTSMVLFKIKVLNGFIFENSYEADGKFICYLNQTRRTEMYYWPIVMAYYNKLKA